MISNLLTVAKYSFLELYKSRILINVLLLGIGLLVISFVASEFTYGVPSRVALDFGLGCTSISAIAIAIFMGSNLLVKEIENRTLYMILSRPISRFEFLSGKILGLLLILFINILILMTITLSLFFFLDGKYNSLLIWNFIYTYLESSIILLVVLFFSMITNQVIAIINTITVLICGHAISGIESATFVQDSLIIKPLLLIGKYTLPNFSKFNIKNFLLYKETLSSEFLIGGLLYGILYLVMLLMATVYIFKNKSLD
jgi:ABC-type transport system involved in multi-copper enzyme maturation permease subunit